MRSIPFSAFWLRSSVVSVLISLISDTRLIESHDINLIFLGCGSIWQPAARTRERRLGLEQPPRLAQPSTCPDRGPNLKLKRQETIHSRFRVLAPSLVHYWFVFNQPWGLGGPHQAPRSLTMKVKVGVTWIYNHYENKNGSKLVSADPWISANFAATSLLFVVQHNICRRQSVCTYFKGQAW
jgi:hypothetical protein